MDIDYRRLVCDIEIFYRVDMYITFLITYYFSDIHEIMQYL